MTYYKGTRNIWKGDNSIMSGAIKKHGKAIVDDIKEFKPRKIANNTVEYYVRRLAIVNRSFCVADQSISGTIAPLGMARIIRLHDTDIVVFHPNGDIELNSGGWLTPTTKERMNRVAEGNYSIWQRDRRWILGIPTTRMKWSSRCWSCKYSREVTDIPPENIPIKEEQESSYVCPKCGEHTNYSSYYTQYDEFPFYDGITIRNGTVLDPREEDPRIGKLEKAINRYCDKIGKLPSIPIPSNGDCWYCLGETGLDSGVSKAEYGVLHEDGTLEKKDWEATHCLESHLDELYIHGSLIWNSLKFVGYRDPAFILRFGNTSMVRRAVRKYFRSKLGLVR